MKSIFSVAIICAFAVSTVCMTGCTEPAPTKEAVEAKKDAAEDMKDAAEGMEDKAMDVKEDAMDMEDEPGHGSDHK